MNFEQKVKSMSAHDIIMAMVDGLRNPDINVHMSNYGCARNGICYGCAATVTVMKIGNVIFDKTNINIEKHTQLIDCSYSFLSNFEEAIDSLRRGSIGIYNRRAKQYGFATIKNGHFPLFRERIELPVLNTDDYKENLHFYEALAKRQKSWI